MVPKKTKSKRGIASKKYKVIKKVAEHHRKQRKEAKKHPQTKRQKKDPGIPNNLPFKDEILQQVEASKQRQADEKERQKEARSRVQSKNRGLSQDQLDAQLEKEAVQRLAKFDIATSIHADGFAFGTFGDAAARSHVARKAPYVDFKRVVEEADVILEVLDARDPFGCRARQIEELIIKCKKRVILVLNKIDLVPREIVEQWLATLRKELPTVAFKAQLYNVGLASISIDVTTESSNDTLGHDNLLTLLRNHCKNAKKPSVVVGVIGFPNVGKSSVLNALKRAVAASTDDAAKIEILDASGIVFRESITDDDEAETHLTNRVQVERLVQPSALVKILVDRLRPAQLMRHYNVMLFSETRDFLIQIARNRGKLAKSGAPDLENAARAVLQDWYAGRIPYYSLPPTSASPSPKHVSPTVVTSCTKEFGTPAVVELETKGLVASIKTKSAIPTRMFTILASDLCSVETELEEMPEGYESKESRSVEDEDDEDEEDEDEDEAEEDSDHDDDDDDEEEAPEAVEIVPTTTKQTERPKPKTKSQIRRETRARPKASTTSKSNARTEGGDEAYDFGEHFPVEMMG